MCTQIKIANISTICIMNKIPVKDLFLHYFFSLRFLIFLLFLMCYTFFPIPSLPPLSCFTLSSDPFQSSSSSDVLPPALIS